MTSSTPSLVDAAATPSAMLSIQAEAWLSRLPAPLRVHGIAEHAPELANRIAATWDDSAGTAALLEGLLVEGVRSLPIGIAAELLRLYDYHVRCRSGDASSATWELPVLEPSGARP